jgi:hypothetical protein
MNSNNSSRRASYSTALLVVFLTAITSVSISFSTNASQSPQASRVINVASEAALTILGASANQHLSGNGSAPTFDVNASNVRAHAIATGDVNGDGIPDLVVGAPDSTFTVPVQGGGTQTRTGAGIAYVVLGRNGLSGTLDTGANQADITILGSKTGDKLGFSVAIGDVNGDGIDDIVIGAPGADFPGSSSPLTAPRNDTGAVFVILGGSALSSPHTIDLAAANAANVALFGVNTGDQFGASVAVGNVGGLTTQTPADQSVKDILVGAPAVGGPDGTSRPGAGAAYLKFGGQALTPIGGATTVFDLAATPANVIVFGKTGDLLGTSVAIGDINGGGAQDIIVGAPLSDRPAATSVPAATDTGAVFAVFGGVNLNPIVGTSKTFDISSGQQNVSVYGAGNRLIPGADDADHLGFSVSAGDVTGDGIPDLLMGAPDADGPSEDRASAGEVYMIQGGPALNPTTGSEKRIDLFNGSATLTVFGAQAGDRFGSTVTSGNYNTVENADTTADLIVGAPGANNRAGLVSIVFGGANILLVTLRDLALGQDNLEIVGQTSANSDLSGKTLRIKQTLTTTDQALTPFLQQLMVSINGNAPVVNDDTQAQFSVGTLTQVVAASTVIAGDTTLAGDLELAPNPALLLDGSTGSMSAPNTASLRPGMGSWTVEFWLKRTGSGMGDFPPVISSRLWSGPFDPGWGVALVGGSFKVSANFADGTSGFNFPEVQSTSSASAGAWEHWAVVFNRAQSVVQFYKNGTLDTSQTVTFPAGAVNQTDALLIGKDTPGGRFLQADVDDIRVWNMARTAQQIQDNFRLELVGNETGLAAYWNFNAGDEKDLTSNHNDGTLSATGATLNGPSDRHFLTGNRVSTFTFPASTNAATSSISWVQTAQAGTSVKIETSLDNGVTFRTASNGGGISSLNEGDELGWAIATADLNNNQGGDLVVGAPFANASVASGVRTQAGLVFMLPSTTSPPPVNLPPTVTVTAPNGGETLQVGQNFDIKWTASDPNGDATIQKFEIRLSTDGGTNFNFTIAPNVVGTARTFTWTVPIGFNTTQGRIRVIATDTGSLTGQDDSNANFTITDAGVTATLTSPNGGQTLRFGQQFTITWTVPAGVEASIKGFDLSLSTDSGQTFPIKIAPSGDPAQPALGPAVRSFVWTVPSICTTKARVAVVTTSITNARTSDTSDADFTIAEPGPTIDTSNMFIFGEFQLFLVTTAPAGGSEILFSFDTLVEVSSDAAGTTFFTFSKPGKVKKSGGKFLSKGTINGQDLGVFFPNAATRFIRITKPTCGITLLKVVRSGEQLLLATAADAEEQPQRVWQ